MDMPQRMAAVPAYIPSHSPVAFSDAAPGHKFLGYLRNSQGAGGEAFTAYKGKARVARDVPNGPEKRAANDRLKQEFDGVLNEVCGLPTSSKDQIKAIRSRQQALHTHHGASGYRISTTSSAPFATGLGNEHPIENGFAFLTPYGLPYLAGSGVKGILRRAMQELLEDGTEGFSDEAINSLFGPETVNKPEDARRGALDFWDVFPNPAGGRLVVEIMTPHFGKYYQGNDTPHDSGQPVPVSFLAVPAKSDFDFHVVCHSSRLPAQLQNQWRSLLDQAFAHAFGWVGFGAKTSVGYGAMDAEKAEQPVGKASGSVGGHAGAVPAAEGSQPTSAQVWPTAKLTLNPSTGAVTAEFGSLKTTPLKAPDADQLRAALGEDRANKLKKNKELKNLAVVVEPLGNGWKLKGLAPA